MGKSVVIGGQKCRQTGGNLRADFADIFFAWVLVEFVLRQGDVGVERDDRPVLAARRLLRGGLIKRLVGPSQIENTYVEKKPGVAGSASP